MDDLQARAQGALKKLQQEGFEIGELFAGAGARKRHPRGDDQRTEQLDGAHPFRAIGDVDGQAGRGGFGRTDALTRLDRGLLIPADHCFALGRQLLGVFVAVQHWDGLVHKLRIVPGEIRCTICCSTATCASFSPDQRLHAFPYSRGALQASAVIWARWSGVKVRLAPARGASRTTSVVCPRRRHCLTVSDVHPTWRAIAALRQVGWWCASSSR